jgi:hypothetical protein
MTRFSGMGWHLFPFSLEMQQLTFWENLSSRVPALKVRLQYFSELDLEVLQVRYSARSGP